MLFIHSANHQSNFSQIPLPVNFLPCTSDKTSSQPLQGVLKNNRKKKMKIKGSNGKPHCCYRDERGCCSSDGFIRAAWHFCRERRTKSGTESFSQRMCFRFTPSWIYLFICTAFFKTKFTKCLTEHPPKNMKYSALFALCNAGIISGLFTCRAGLDRALMKPIVPTERKHWKENLLEGRNFEQIPGSQLKLGGYPLEPEIAGDEGW